MVYDSSLAISIRDFDTPFYYIREQARGLFVAIVVLIICSAYPYRKWFDHSVTMLFITMGLLVAVFIPGFGISALGAHRWLKVGPLVLQPAEVTKLVLTIYLSAWFSTKERGRLNAFLLLVGVITGLVLLEPDLGTTIIIVSIAFVLYFMSGAPVKHFALLVPLLVVGVIIMSVIAPYRMRRLTTFFNPDSDPQGSSYQVKQGLIALGSGGLFGVGIGKSMQKYEYLPEANTDSIFAIIGEETGFVGATAILGLLLLIVLRGFRIASRMHDPFGRMLAVGISTWIGIQAGINIAAMVALVPLTGVPLPFISYGSSSLVMLFAAIGILMNISSYAHDMRVTK